MALKSDPEIKGFPVDGQTRCIHYHSERDIIAIRFKCCDEYYPCIHCHEEAAGHAVERWPESERNRKAILCGACKTELSIHEYFGCNYHCPHCGAAFNPGCRNHNHFYFEGD
ncbi:CHY zinc finger protein [Flaviaesturariibacter flavus]|uniref:CHY zinc finger protein n=1 Tax=Flaviaesturariibacter flavus TaxID=2502780 RepID=UPI001A9D6F16|nr:CHY zinc finger protein [Flaviaesturariibacter flavus]